MNNNESNLICAENVAFGKRARMSSQYSGGDGTSGPACMAVNGNRSHILFFSDPGRNCIHTDVYENKPWWSVDLGSNFTIRNVTIYNRDGCKLFNIAKFTFYSIPNFVKYL